MALPSKTPAKGAFASTRWSLVARAASDDGDERRTALGELCEAYWFPLYAYVRRRGFDVEEARDLVQGFFARLLERGDLEVADPLRGRFRAFLLTSLQSFLSNELERARALKRGGDRSILPMDFKAADSRYGYEPFHEETPERVFLRTWALDLVDRAMDRLGRESAARGRGPTFERLQEFLGGERGKGYRAAAVDLGVTESAVKVAVHRLRGRLREIMRAEIADTLPQGASVDDEMRELFAALQP